MTWSNPSAARRKLLLSARETLNAEWLQVQASNGLLLPPVHDYYGELHRPSVLYYRHRRSNFALAEPSLLSRVLRPAIGIALALGVLYVSGGWLMRTIGLGNHSRQTGVVLSVEKRGGVQVSIDGKEYVNAQDGMKLYAADRVRTGAGGAAARFFDGTVLRLADQTEVIIVQSDQKSADSVIAAALSAGSVWISTPTAESYSGSILRTLTAGELSFSVPARTDAVFGARSAAVYAAAGLGVQIEIPDAAIPIIVGEGQQFALPENYDPDEDLYQYRSPLGSLAALPAFVQESRALYLAGSAQPRPVNASGAVVGGATDLTVLSPVSGATVRTATVQVRGSVSARVASVRVNGYLAAVADDRSFALEVSLQDGQDVTITVEALDAQGGVVETAVRELKRDLAPPAPPSITGPAKDGQTYRTQRTEVEIRGTAPAGAAGIVVNDYRLQLFKPGDAAWTYLASTKLGNYQPGVNVFTAVSVDESGMKSAPVTLTIRLEEGAEGVIDAGSAGSASAAPVSEDQLPQNAPLQPGTVRVTGPAEGTQFTATGAFLLEGSAPPATDSVWVNGYKLKLYAPGKSFWNYIADPAFATLKKGVNTYRINARDAEGKLLDTTTYTVTY